MIAKRGPRYAARMRRAAIALGIALLAAAAIGLSARPLAAQARPDPQALAEQAIRRLDLQTELPRRQEPFVRPWRLTLPPEVLWVVVIIGIGWLLYQFRDTLQALLGPDGSWAGEEGGAAEMAARAPEVVLGAADGLAAEGRFVEAMHVLLLQALLAIRRRLEEPFADSMTSREILRSKHLSDELRRPLRDVVGRVEWTYFGEHPAVREDYLACRASFNDLAQALRGGAAA
jgi:hypothetical protein